MRCIGLLVPLLAVTSGEAPASLFDGTADTTFEGDAIGASLGHAVASADVNGDGFDDVIMGAPYGAGHAVLIFHGAAGGIANGHAIAADTLIQSTRTFGWQVAAADVNDDGYADVAVSASSAEDGGPADRGAVLLFLGSASGISASAPLDADAILEGDQAGSDFGGAIAAAGDVNGDGYDDLAVSDPLYDAGQLDEGAVFVFHGGAAGIASGGPASAATRLESNWSPVNDGPGAFGADVAGAGDVNGDGYDDVVVGDPDKLTTLSLVHTGAAYLFLGTPSGVANGSPATAATRLYGEGIYSESFGFGVAGAGAVDADGYDDVIVGDKDADAPSSLRAGAAYVFHGAAGGIPDATAAEAKSILRGHADHRAVARTVAGAGDVNGDGFADVMFSDGYGNTFDPETNEGGVYVFLGRSGGILDALASDADASFEPDQAYASLGGEALAAGDVDGDGADDVLAGASGWDSGQLDEGGTFLLRGTPRACGNAFDDDGDSAIDFPADAGCESIHDDTESVDCANGVDDDGDGRVDAADPGCADASDASEQAAGVACDDGLDNDGDGLVDEGGDPGCFDPTWAWENPACDDELDNDGDGARDWDGAGVGAPDPQCIGKPYRNRETPNPGCGLGAELVLALGILAASRRR